MGKPIKLTKPLLEAIWVALDAALAGDGFAGGDFEGQDRSHFERALRWVEQETRRRASAKTIIREPRP